MKFFFDRNMSVHLARMLDQYDRQENIIHQDDDVRFERDTDDVTLIRTVGEEDPKPVWVSADIRQRRDRLERAAMLDSGMTCFFFKNLHNRPIHHQALKVLAVWPEIVNRAQTVRVPTVFEIPSGPIAKGAIHDKITALGPVSEYFRAK